jgi:hypothetical protein
LQYRLTEDSAHATARLANRSKSGPLPQPLPRLMQYPQGLSPLNVH